MTSPGLITNYPLKSIPSIGDRIPVINSSDNSLVLVNLETIAELLGLYPITAFGARGDATRLEANVTTTSGSAVVSCPSATFTSSDVGKVFCVRGAANTIIVNSTIASVQSPTQVTLAAQANATTATGTALYGTDNTTYIQNVIDFCATLGTSTATPLRFKGAVPFVPNGSFLSGPLTGRQHTGLTGAGESSVLVMLPAITGAGLILNDVNACFVPVRNLRIDGSYDFQTQSAGVGPDGIKFDNSASYNPATMEESDPYPMIDHVTIYNVWGSGIKLLGRGEAKVTNITGRNIRGDGIITCFDSIFSDISLGVIGGTGFNVGNDALGGKILGDKINVFHTGNPLLGANTENWSTALHGGAGFFIFNSQGVILTNCNAQDTAGPGFHLDTVLDSQLIGCTVDSCSAALQGDPGFNLANSHRNFIKGHVRDRGPTERTGELIGGNPSHYAVRYAYRSWFIDSQLGPANNVVEITTDINPALSNHSNVYPKSQNSNATEGAGEHVVIDNQEGIQVITYDPSFATTGFTPNPYDGGTIVMTLTGNLIINNTATYNKHYGVEMSFILTQDATGGRTITFAGGSNYKYSWTPNTGVSKVNTIKFKWNGAAWIMQSAQVGL